MVILTDHDVALVISFRGFQSWCDCPSDGCFLLVVDETGVSIKGMTHTEPENRNSRENERFPLIL